MKSRLEPVRNRGRPRKASGALTKGVCHFTYGYYQTDLPITNLLRVCTRSSASCTHSGSRKMGKVPYPPSGGWIWMGSQPSHKTG